MGRICRQWAALVAGALWPVLRWLPSEANPADAPSRRALRIGATFRWDAVARLAAATADAADKNAKGRTATAFNATMQPATFVIDRKGVVRAAGLKTGSLKPVLEKLLAEPAPSKTPAK